MQDLIQQYKESLRKVRKAKETANEVDRSILSGMERDLEFAIKWMKTGRMPGNHRGVESPHAYHREIPVDPQRFPFEKYETPFEQHDGYVRTGRLSEDEAEFFYSSLDALTEKQREVFLMYYRDWMSLEEIAETLGVPKTTAQDRLERARQKIERITGIKFQKKPYESA